MRKSLVWLTGVSVVICLALTGCDLNEKYERSVSMPLPVSTGQKLVVHTHVGSITASGGDVPQPAIKAKITGKADTIENAQAVAEAINIIVENQNGTVVIKIDKPLIIKNDWFTVDYCLDVPQDISLDARTNVGSITISDINGDIAASSNVGTIVCRDTRGKMDLNTNVGDISLFYAPDANSQVDATLSVDVGSIHFKGPQNMSAKVDVSTDVGSIHSNLPITVQGNICSKRLSGTVGQGKGSVRLRTDVGSIHIE